MTIELHPSGDPVADRRADYAAMLAEAGDATAAADLMRQALELAPAWVAGWFRLGEFAATAGLLDEAGEAFRTVLRLDPSDRLGAELKLAVLGRLEVPAAAPAAFVQGLFDQYAHRFDAALVERLAYRIPTEIRNALAEHCGPQMRFADVLDLGCGTGLMGECLRTASSRISGIDLSPGMLAKAAQKGIYDSLAAGDIVLSEGIADASVDLVTAADVLIYLGDLAPLFSRVRAVLKPGGLFAFSLEAHSGEEDYVLRTSMRFAHSAAALRRLAEASGFELREERRTIARLDRGEPVESLIYILGAATQSTERAMMTRPARPEAETPLH